LGAVKFRGMGWREEGKIKMKVGRGVLLLGCKGRDARRNEQARSARGWGRQRQDNTREAMAATGRGRKRLH